MKKNSLLKLSIITILILIVLFTLFLVLFCVFSPKTSANFAKSIGLNNLSQKLYYNDYKKNKSLNSLYNSLNINIELNNNKNIISEYELLSKDNNYFKLINQQQDLIIKSNNNLIIKSNTLNINNYLSNKYVKALIINNRSDYAFNFSYNNLINIKDFNFNLLNNYCFHNFLNDVSSISKFSSKFLEKNDEMTYFEKIKDYYERLNKFLNLHKNDTFENDKIYKIAFANNIIEVGMDILSLNNHNSIQFPANRDLISNNIKNLKSDFIRNLL